MPDYDKTHHQLLSFTSEWAFFRSKSDSSLHTIAQRVDGDWELNDSGEYEEMMSKFMRMAFPTGTGTLNSVDGVSGRITQLQVSPAEPEPALADDRYCGNPMFGRF